MSSGKDFDAKQADDFMVDIYRGMDSWKNPSSSHSSSNSSFKPIKESARCYHGHPPIPLGEGILYGGNCQTPAAKDCDIYIALDGYTHSRHQTFPWDPPSKIIEFTFPITDMHAPSNSKEFKKMITWMCNQLHSGKHIHVGCMGGHGRTGTVLAAVVCEFTGNKDSIKWVRENYCHKAVESSEQIRFLNHHYDVSKVKASKEGFGGSGSSSVGFSSGLNWKPSSSTAAGHPKQKSLWPVSKPTVLGNPTGSFAGAKKTYKPVLSSRAIW